MSGAQKMTPEDEARLRELVAEGLHAAEIARRLGWIPQNVRYRCALLDLPLSRYLPPERGRPPAWVDEARILRAEGAKFHEIAQRFGVSLAAARYWVSCRTRLIYLDDAAADWLRTHAATRRVTVNTLVQRIIHAIAADNIIDAVLDDGGGA